MEHHAPLSWEVDPAVRDLYGSVQSESDALESLG